MTCSYLKSCKNPAAEGSTKCSTHLAQLSEYAKTWRDKNRDRIEAQRRERYAEAVRAGIGVWSRGSKRYGLTREQYLEMLEAQDRLCAICGCPETALGPTGKVKNLAIDHCHETNRVRGLLCNNCNRALGLLKDREEVLLAAVAYLQQTSVMA